MPSRDEVDHLASLQLVSGGFGLLVVVNVLGHLPDLHDVILGDRTDDPRMIRVPRKVADFRRVTAVDEK